MTERPPSSKLSVLIPREMRPMTLRGIVQAVELVENPPGSDTIEMVVKAQGVGPSHPRKFVIPFDLLLTDDALDPDAMQGHAFQAEIEEETPGRWKASQVSLATSRVLRPPE